MLGDDAARDDESPVGGRYPTGLTVAFVVTAVLVIGLILSAIVAVTIIFPSRPDF